MPKVYISIFHFLSVWKALGVSSTQVARDIMENMTQEFVTEQDYEEEKLNKEIDELLDGIDFQQSMSQEESPTCIPSSYPEENDEKNREEEMSPLLLAQEECDTEENKTSVPIVQPFTCSEEKSPMYYDDPMDTLEEVPVANIQDTYLTDAQFNEKYPHHPIDAKSIKQEEQKMETEPHVLGLEEFEIFLDNQETNGELIEQVIIKDTVQEVEVLQDPVTEAYQSNEVCLF